MICTLLAKTCPWSQRQLLMSGKKLKIDYNQVGLKKWPTQPSFNWSAHQLVLYPSHIPLDCKPFIISLIHNQEDPSIVALEMKLPPSHMNHLIEYLGLLQTIHQQCFGRGTYEMLFNPSSLVASSHGYWASALKENTTWKKPCHLEDKAHLNYSTFLQNFFIGCLSAFWAGHHIIPSHHTTLMISLVHLKKELIHTGQYGSFKSFVMQWDSQSAQRRSFGAPLGCQSWVLRLTL